MSDCQLLKDSTACSLLASRKVDKVWLWAMGVSFRFDSLPSDCKHLIIKCDGTKRSYSPEIGLTVWYDLVHA
jgi:hypothetical protein